MMTADPERSQPTAHGPEGSSEGQLDDFTQAESVGAAIRRAFPLPESGAFADLLAALDCEL
jgi:hypothetical protein